MRGHAEALRVCPSERRESTPLLHWPHLGGVEATLSHNAGDCRHTAKYRPWSIDMVVEFADERRAVAFERYLKSGSGVAFAKRHLR